MKLLQVEARAGVALNINTVMCLLAARLSATRIASTAIDTLLVGGKALLPTFRSASQALLLRPV